MSDLRAAQTCYKKMSRASLIQIMKLSNWMHHNVIIIIIKNCALSEDNIEQAK